MVFARQVISIESDIIRREKKIIFTLSDPNYTQLVGSGESVK